MGQAFGDPSQESRVEATTMVRVVKCSLKGVSEHRTQPSHRVAGGLSVLWDRRVPRSALGARVVNGHLQRFNWTSASRTPSEPSFRI